MSGAIFTVLWVAAGVAALVWLHVRDTRKRLVTTYAEDLRQFRTWGRKAGLAAGVGLFVSIPVGMSWLGYKGLHFDRGTIPGVPFNEKWMFVLALAGIFAIGAIGLNLLIGNTGQISLGNSAFLALGSYGGALIIQGTKEGGAFKIAGYRPHGVLVLAFAAVLGGLVSAAIGPFALRLRGSYLAIVSLFLVLLAEHLVNNWKSVTGGEDDPRTLPSLRFVLWPGKVLELRTSDTSETSFFDYFFFKDKVGHFWVVWICVAICALAAANLLRSRQGRAMMAVRDRDLSAEAIGVRQMYTKTWAFAVSGAMAALAGALYGSFYGFVNTASFGFAVAFNFVAMIIIGGIGSVAGSVLGAVVVTALPEIIKYYRSTISTLPFIQSDPAKRGFTEDRLVLLLYGLSIVLFLWKFPGGLIGLWLRVKRYFRTWPFSG